MIKIFRKFLSYKIKIFILGQMFSKNFCPTQKIFPTPHRKPGESPIAKEGKKETEVCVTCGKPAKSDCIEFSCCGQWKHSQCNNLSTDKLKVLGNLPPNVMFFCNVCQPKVTISFEVP